MKKIEVIIDVITGEETSIERDETPQEKSEREALEKEIAQRKIEEENKAIARQALLVQLGITEEQAKLLLS